MLKGRQGYDWLLGGLGADTIRGGPEDDLIVLRAGDIGVDENELIDGGTGQDILVLNGFTHSELHAVTLLGSSSGFLSDPRTGGTYYVAAVEQVRHAHLFTHVGPVEERAVSFVLVNPSRIAASSGHIVSFDREGQLLPLSIDGGASESTYSFTVPPLGRVTIEGSTPDPSTPGTAQLLVDHGLSGYIEAGAAAAEVELLDSFMVPVREDRAAGIHTGVAIISSTVPSRVKLTLHKPSGEEASTQNRGGVEIDLPAHGSRVVFVREIFGDLLGEADKFQGTMTVEGGIDRPQEGGSLAATGIQQLSTNGELFTFPVTPVGPLPAAQTLYFPVLVSGGEGVTSLVLVNPSPLDRAKGTLAFFDDAGQAWSIAVNELSATGSVPYDIGPLGSALFTVPGGGPLQLGSARAETTEGRVGGVLGLASPTFGTEVAGPSGAFERLIAPVQRNRASGLNVEVALSSVQSVLNLELVLRDTRGTEVEEGSARLRLPANGSTRRLLDDLFPNADTDNFEGSVSVIAEGGMLAAHVMQVGGGSAGRAMMPVARLDP